MAIYGNEAIASHYDLLQVYKVHSKICELLHVYMYMQENVTGNVVFKVQGT